MGHDQHDRLTSPPAASTPASPPGTEIIPPLSSTPRAAGVGAETAGRESALARYARATAPGGWLTADGWLRLAADLDAAARAAALASLRHRNRGEQSANLAGAAQSIRDRAADCRQRAAALTRGAL